MVLRIRNLKRKVFLHVFNTFRLKFLLILFNFYPSINSEKVPLTIAIQVLYIYLMFEQIILIYIYCLITKPINFENPIAC